MNVGFIVGTGRCGSSLVHELVASHEQVGFISNVDDNLPQLPGIGRFNNSLYWLSNGAWTQKGKLRFAPSEGYKVIGQKVSQIYVNSSRDLLKVDVSPWLREQFHEFFESKWRAQRCTHFIHKYTGWPRIGFFGDIFPTSRFVHVVRDGRAVANSWLQTAWWGGYRGPEHWQWGPLPSHLNDEWENSGRSFVALAGLGWRLLIESYLDAMKQLESDRCMEVKYEELVASPGAVIARIAEFFGVDVTERLSAAVNRINYQAKRAEAYETELTSAQINELERCIGPVLGRYGYI